MNTRIIGTFPEIIAICETKLNDDIGNETIPKMYTIIKKNRIQDRVGVCIMVHEDFNSTLCTDVNCGFSVSIEFRECLRHTQPIQHKLS